jgi:cytoskeletal protein CcmA (bactofilin family)
LSYKRVYLANKAFLEGSVYSHGTIEVRDEATVKPYSLLFCNGNGKSANQRMVSLEGEVNVSGTIIANNTSGIVFLDEDALFTGIIFSKASVDIRGSVQGSVSTPSLIHSLCVTKIGLFLLKTN